MDSRVSAAIACAAVAVACHFVLLLIAVRNGNRLLPLACVAVIYGSGASIVLAVAYIVHITGAQP